MAVTRAAGRIAPRMPPPSPAMRQFLRQAARDQARRVRILPVPRPGGMMQAGTAVAAVVGMTSGLACLLLG